ncbi:hypothetical protein ACU19_04810 [Actinobaculum suis]|uniref:hypothetical protein n=1 Tax=Actinobaculum suis TaxID=1657 RepID=UPI00066FBDE7|nr:hypothetical protein [Actinobaculum suis]KMY23299.1 hypothetical protein ACU19_04810 [Actinobaculum suis]
MWTVVATPGRDLPASAEKAAGWIGNHPGICLTSRGDTTPVIDTLLNPPATAWVVSIAVSGQKHVLPYAEINHGGYGVVRMENSDIPYLQGEWEFVFKHALALRRLGVPAADVGEGNPRYLKTREELELWQNHNTALGPFLRSPLLDLALWTITKGIIENDKY